jgi:hypothetical protein
MLTQFLAGITAINPTPDVTPHSVRTRIRVLFGSSAEERLHG